MDPGFERALEDVVKGEFDLAKVERYKNTESTDSDALGAYLNAAKSGDDPDQVKALGAALFEDNKDDMKALNDLAWTIAWTRSLAIRDFDLMTHLIDRAIELSEAPNSHLLDTKSRVLFELGAVDEAIALQEKAIALATDPSTRFDHAMHLAEYRAAAKAD